MKKIFLYLFFLFAIGSLQAQKPNAYFTIAIKDSVDNLLKDLQQNAAFTETGEKISDKMVRLFTALHVHSNVQILNDLQPDLMLGSPISVQDYVVYAKENYPSGFDVKFNYNIETLEEAVKVNDNRQKVFITVSKTFTGFYQNKQVVNKTVVFVYEIMFTASASSVFDFKINAAYTEKAVLKMKLSAKQKGLHVGISIQGGPTTVGATGSDWSVASKTGLGFGLDINYFVSSGFALCVGANYASYGSNYSLPGYADDYKKVTTYRAKETDADNENYYRLITATIFDESSITALDIPIGFMLRLGRADKFGFYIKPAVVASLILGGTSSVTGTSTHSGYYPEYPVVLDDLAPYGFTTVTYNDSYDWLLGKTAFSAQIGAGFSIPVGKKMFVNLGGIYQMGLTDIGYTTAKYRDDYLSINGDPKTMKLNKVGGALSVTFKL